MIVLHPVRIVYISRGQVFETLGDILGDCRKRKYQIAKDFRPSSRSCRRSIAPLCDSWRDAEDGRQDEQAGMFFDRNRPILRALQHRCRKCPDQQRPPKVQRVTHMPARSSSMVLYYVHDPMCSWCYGFAPTLDQLMERLPEQIRVERLLGGLAADSDLPMAMEMRDGLQHAWRRIAERIPGTRFNFDFWTRCEPRRSTYRACRAVIAARDQGAAFDRAMTAAVQRAYYREARNPSDRDTLIALAREIGAEPLCFAAALDAPQTQDRLDVEIAHARSIGVDSFPSLVLDNAGSRWRIPVEYTNADAMLELIQQVILTE